MNLAHQAALWYGYRTNPAGQHWRTPTSADGKKKRALSVKVAKRVQRGQQLSPIEQSAMWHARRSRRPLTTTKAGILHSTNIRKGRLYINPEFVEWLMGLPCGLVCDPSFNYTPSATR